MEDRVQGKKLRLCQGGLVGGGKTERCWLEELWLSRGKGHLEDPSSTVNALSRVASKFAASYLSLTPWDLSLSPS